MLVRSSPALRERVPCAIKTVKKKANNRKRGQKETRRTKERRARGRYAHHRQVMGIRRVEADLTGLPSFFLSLREPAVTPVSPSRTVGFASTIGATSRRDRCGEGYIPAAKETGQMSVALGDACTRFAKLLINAHGETSRYLLSSFPLAPAHSRFCAPFRAHGDYTTAHVKAG